MKINKDIFFEIIMIVIFAASITIFLVYHFHGGYNWIKVEKQLESRYGCNIKKVYEDRVKNKDGSASDILYLFKDEYGFEYKVKYSTNNGIIEDDFANAVYAEEYVEDIKSVTDKYFDEYMCIPNFFNDIPPDIPFENSGSFEDYDAYIKDSGYRRDYTILIREDTDISSVDELIKKYEKTFSESNIAIAIEQVPNNIYDGNVGVKSYEYIDYRYAGLDKVK